MFIKLLLLKQLTWHILAADLLFKLAFLLLFGDGIERLVVIVGELVAAMLEHGSSQFVELVIDVAACSR